MVNVHTTLRSAHLYFFKHWVLRLLAERPQLHSVQRDLLPLLVRAQHRPQLLDADHGGADATHDATAARTATLDGEPERPSGPS